MFQIERNFIRHAIGWKLGKYKPYRPLCAYVYLTFRCNLSCVYCNDGTGRKYPDCDSSNELDTQSWLQVLKILKRETDVLILTGGEPTMRTDLRAILEGCRAMGYKNLTLLTNALTLDRHIEVFENCTIVMISLDTLNEQKATSMMGMKPGSFHRLMDNVRLASEMRKKYGFRLYFNIIVTPENISDAHGVVDFCLRRKIGFAPVPEVVAFYPREQLKGNAEYEEFINRILRLKKGGCDVLGTMGYLRGIRRFDDYRCLPTLLARVWPNGDLLYPCQKLHKVGGNLLKLGDYSRAIDEGRREHGPLPDCDNRCHAGCYMDFSMCVQQPSLIVKEALDHLKRPFFKPDRFLSETADQQKLSKAGHRRSKRSSTELAQER